MTGERLHLVTGKLAATALDEVVQPLSAELGFTYSIDVLPITVAGLMTPAWVARHVAIPPEATQLWLPGNCQGDLQVLQEQSHCPVVVGPKDLRELPDFLGSGRSGRGDDDYGNYQIEILAEINHAPRMSWPQIQQLARSLRADGADLIDMGCIPGETWEGAGEVVSALVGEGFRVSIDSMNVAEVTAAVQAGAELVLSVTSANCDAAADWGCQVVAIPDPPSDLRSLEATLNRLDQRRVPYRIDPILEPMGFGFADSVERYFTCRRRFPEAEMMMGIGNITELTDCDSAGINMMLIALCEELQVRSILTTQVITWARTAVRECDVARRLAHHAVSRRQLPKHVEDRLLMLRDPRLFEQGERQLQRLADQIRDHGYRIYAERDQIHLITTRTYLADRDPFVLLKRVETLCQEGRLPALSPSHAFYLGHELCKASLALQLGKQYRQDEPLQWGLINHHAAHG